MNWVVVSTGIIIFAGFVIGVYRGAIRIAVSLATTIVTLILVTLVTPFVAKAIDSLTPLDDMIQSQVSNAMVNAAASQVTGENGEELSEDSVRRVLEAAGISEEKLEEFGIEIDDIVSGRISGEELAEYGISSSILDGLKDSGTVKDAVENAEIPRDMQVAAIEAADLPDLFKSLLSTNNNNEIYKELGAETFAQYVGRFLSKLIINILAFLSTFILVTIILRAIIFALDVVSGLPVFGFLNRFAGGIVGILCALVIVWVLFVIVTLLYVTSTGKEIYETIQGNGMLKIIYDYNPIMKLAIKF